MSHLSWHPVAMRNFRTALLSSTVAPALLALGCGGGGGAGKPVATAEMPPSVDCGRTIEALAPVLETPVVILVGDPEARVSTLVGDIACQVAAGGHQVVVAFEPDAGNISKTDLAARVESMRAAGLEVVVAQYKLSTGVKRLTEERPEARLVVLADSVDAIRGIAAYAINVVGDAANVATVPALRSNPQREGGFDAVLDLGVMAEPPAAPAEPVAPADAVGPTPAG